MDLILFTGLLTTLAILIAHAIASPKSQLFGPVLAAGQTSQPIIALTFDDGPSPATVQILDSLACYQAKATFFLIGQNVKRYPHLARRIVAGGHAVGSHSYRHQLWGALKTTNQIAAELDKAAAVIQETTGVRPTLFRPPDGWRSPWLIRLARQKGYLVVTWSVSPNDWRPMPPRAITERVRRQTCPGAIILLHDGLGTRSNPSRQNTVTALPKIIESLQAQGYRLVTVPELIQV